MAGRSLVPLAVGASLVAAAIEYPISQRYVTVPSTSTAKRMTIAGGMVFASVLVAGWIGRSLTRHEPSRR
jgi:hypothetical protein